MIANTHDSPGVREIVLVMGMTGWGKSWWSKLYAKKHDRKLVYDPSVTFPVDEYLPIGEINDQILDPENKGKPFNYGFIDAEEIPAGAGALFVLEKNLLIVEECATVFEKGQRTLPDWGKRHCFYGRHQSCSIVLIAQRPAYMPVDFRSQANRVVTFCQHEDTDMDWLQGFYGKERMNRMLSMPKFTCFDWHDNHVTEYSIVGKVKSEFDVSLDKHTSNELPSYV